MNYFELLPQHLKRVILLYVAQNERCIHKAKRNVQTVACLDKHFFHFIKDDKTFNKQLKCVLAQYANTSSENCRSCEIIAKLSHKNLAPFFENLDFHHRTLTWSPNPLLVDEARHHLESDPADFLHNIGAVEWSSGNKISDFRQSEFWKIVATLTCDEQDLVMMQLKKIVRYSNGDMHKMLSNVIDHAYASVMRKQSALSA
jgi:hypothetical protein